MTNTARDLPLLLQPAGTARLRSLALAVIPLLLASAALVILAAWAMPEGYSWLVLSISESAAQGQRHGWIARLSFMSFGSAVLLLSLSMRGRWPRLTYWCHLGFAASMFGAAAFSHSPWQGGAPNDPTEDFLHSFFASGMGFAFCAGVLARFLQRGPAAVLGRSLDVAALLVATALPLLLAASSSVGGLMQRVMFAVAYLWYGREALIGLGVVAEAKCRLTLRSSGPSPARHLGREVLRSIMHLAAKAPCLRGPLSSNVRRHHTPHAIRSHRTRGAWPLA